MKRVYEVEVYFDYPWDLRAERERRTFHVEAGSVGTAVKLGAQVARRHENVGGYAPRITSVKEMCGVDAR